MKKFIVPALLMFISFSSQLFAENAFDHIKPYGNLYLYFGGEYAKTFNSGGDSSIDSDLVYRINNNSNLGFNFNYKKYSGVFELGIDDVENDRDVKIRKAYGEYKLSFGELMIGQSWSPFVTWSHEFADYYRSNGFGSLYEDPVIQMKLVFAGFYVDIMKPYVPTNKLTVEEVVNIPTAGTGAATEYKKVTVERDVTTGQPLENIKSFIPKFAAGYEYKGKDWRIGGGLAGSVYYIDETEGDVKFNKNWIYSYLAYLNLDFSFTKDFAVYMSGGFLVNPANYGISVQSAGNSTYTGGAAMAIENIATGEWEIKDTWNVQSFIEFEYEFSYDFKAYLGYGFSMVKYPADGTDIDYAMEYFATLKINLAGLIAISPTLSFRDLMKDMGGNDEGYEITGGILATVSYY